MATVYLSLGSNLGNRLDQLRKAIHAIGGAEGIKVRKISSVYETEPVGGVPQANFYNVVVEIETELLPRELLETVQEIEKMFGRTRDIHWGPRVIDIDILLYDEAEISEKDLVIPHPEMGGRAFVLIPLVEIEPDLRLPGGDLACDLLGQVSGQKVKKIGSHL